MKREVFPFSAVMGQESVKNALIWNFINPKIGGVLLSGEKGTAKSTLVRSGARICEKEIVEVPLNTTEDRLIGAIDFEKAIRYGKKQLDKGLLGEADQNILYVDEINLLGENITKAFLEASSEGICRVEREGISEHYSSEFVLIGSMNPEEGILRPQLLDRFGLYVEVVAEENLLVRCEIVRRYLAFEKSPEAFLKKYEKEDAEVKAQIKRAQERLASVYVSENALKIAAELSMAVNCQGSRGELALVETARAICAWKGLDSVNKDALVEAAKYALPHRMRAGKLPESEKQEPQESKQEERENAKDTNSEGQKQNESQKNTSKDQDFEGTSENNQEEASETFEPSDSVSSSKEQIEECGESFEVGRWLENDDLKMKVTRGSGRRSLVKTNMLQGRYVKSTMKEGRDLAFDATLRAAAPYQKMRDKNGLAFAIRKCDFRQKVREKRTGNFLIFVVDASGSMGAGKRMKAVKGAILSLLGDAYQKRDKVAMITFRRDGAKTILGMTRSIDLAVKKLENIATGGKTPLYAGLEMAHTLVLAARKKEKELMPVIILVSDGRATEGKSVDPFIDAKEAARAIAADAIKSVVIDTEQGFLKLRLAEKIAVEMNADVYQLSGLHADAILCAVKQAVNT